jgi:hypothetical protein
MSAGTPRALAQTMHSTIAHQDTAPTSCFYYQIGSRNMTGGKIILWQYSCGNAHVQVISNIGPTSLDADVWNSIYESNTTCNSCTSLNSDGIPVGSSNGGNPVGAGAINGVWLSPPYING